MASRAKGVVRRENIITALLLIASARWHFALLAAGALWRGKSSAPRQKTSILTPDGKKPIVPPENSGLTFRPRL